MTLFRYKNSLQSSSHFLSLNKLLKIYLVMIRIFMGGGGGKIPYNTKIG